MSPTVLIRNMLATDLTAVKHIIDDTDMFPSEYLDEMVEGYLSKQTEERWYVIEDNEQNVISVAYCAPERMTEGTWNLLLIAVLKQHQGKGIGAQLMKHAEDELRQLPARVLLVETSGLPEYELTRRFYPKIGYTQVAVIPEYYDKGDDKVVFYKSLH